MLFAKYSGEKYNDHDGRVYHYTCTYDFQQRGVVIDQEDGYFPGPDFYELDKIYTCSARYSAMLHYWLQQRYLYATLVARHQICKDVAAIALEYLTINDCGIYWKLINVQATYIAPLDCFCSHPSFAAVTQNSKKKYNRRSNGERL